MNKLLVLTAAGAAMLLAAGCASDGGYVGGDVGYNYAGPPDVWYDGYYGPYVDGYWGDGGVFFYSDSHGHFTRDDGAHFRNRAFEGGQRFHARARPDRDHDRR
jgi:hypothetical protein